MIICSQSFHFKRMKFDLRFRQDDLMNAIIISVWLIIGVVK